MKTRISIERYNQIVWAVIGSGALIFAAIGIVTFVVSLWPRGQTGVPVEVVGALGAGIVGSWEALGRELGRGEPVGAMLEYDRGLVVVHGVAATAVLVIGVAGPAALGRVRYAVKKALPDLAGGV